MNNDDQLSRFIFEKLDIRGELINLKSSWKEILSQHRYPQYVQKQLGDALASVAILASSIKFEGSLILQIQGDGPLSTLVAQATHQGQIRGIAKFKKEDVEGDLCDIFGKGRILITVQSSKGEPYQSIVPLEGATLSEALAHYFLASEQLKSHFCLFVNQDQISGLFLQELPSQATNSDHSLDNWERLIMIANTLTPDEIHNLKPEALLHRLYHEESIRLFEPKLIRFECSCSQQKIESSLVAIGQKTLLEIIEEEGKVEVDCEFCNQIYLFNLNQIEELFNKVQH